MIESAWQRCMAPDCSSTYGIDEVLFACRRCGALLDIAYDWSRCQVPGRLSDLFVDRSPSSGNSGSPATRSGVWRFHALLPFAPLDELVTIGEGRTHFQQADGLAAAIGMMPGRLFLQYEGFNPSGSFKDNGMAAAFTVARRLNRCRVACASTGNTSASLAIYASLTHTPDGSPMTAVVFVGGGKIALGKLAQALDHGAITFQVDGDFDACMRLIQQSADRLNLYLVNSINPFRLEGQKTIMYRVLERLHGDPPDWIVVPGGNLGNASAFGKAFIELREMGLVTRIPRLAVMNAAGANTLSELYNVHGVRYNGGRPDRTTIDAYFAHALAEGRQARTVATAIEIGRPVNLPKALRSLEAMDGVVRQVADDEILDGKALVGRHGLGCEPASGATVAGLRALLAERVVAPSDRVVCILTGHALKDPNVTVDYHQGTKEGGPRAALANSPVRIAADPDAIARVLGGHGDD